MKTIPLFCIVLLSLTNVVHAADAEPLPEAKQAQAAANGKDGFCLFSGAPPSEVKYTKVKQVKVGKGSYGGVTSILPLLVDQAREAGADAIINYSGSQRFGLLPWRLVRPVVHGTAVKWSGPAPDCKAIGGTTLSQVLEENRAPAQ